MSGMHWTAYELKKEKKGIDKYVVVCVSGCVPDKRAKGVLLIARVHAAVFMLTSSFLLPRTGVELQCGSGHVFRSSSGGGLLSCGLFLTVFGGSVLLRQFGFVCWRSPVLQTRLEVYFIVSLLLFFLFVFETVYRIRT